MSAINPASFQTPLSGLQVPGTLCASGPTAFVNGIDHYTSRRHQRQHPTTTSVGPAQAGLSTSDQAWNTGRDGSALEATAFQQLYGQPFQGNDLDVRQLDHYPVAYRQNTHQMLNMQPPFTSGSFNSPNHHPYPSYASRPDSRNGGPQSSQVLGQDWNPSLHGLSLGH